MASPYHLSLHLEPKLDDWELLFKGLNQQAADLRGMAPMAPLAIMIKDDHNKAVGGIQAISFYGCLYIEMLWVEPALRSQGWGTQLVKQVETIAKERNCRFMTVSTMDWEAMPFYQKLGFRIDFVREGFEKDSKLYMMRKEL